LSAISKSIPRRKIKAVTIATLMELDRVNPHIIATLMELGRVGPHFIDFFFGVEIKKTFGLQNNCTMKRRKKKKS
jgi:hypothetical protein